MTPRQTPLPQPLPRRVVPLRHETCDSYLARLAAANRVDVNDLDELADLDDDDPASLERLAALTGHPAPALLHALPELRHHPAIDTSALPGGACPTPKNFINDIRPPCRRCAATACADPRLARVWATHDVNVCLRHRLWIGQGTGHPRHQIDLGPHPDIMHAQIRHRRILRRHGRPATSAAFRHAYSMWASLTTTGSYAQQRDTRSARVRSGTNGTSDAEEAITEAVLYPETVAFTAMLASPYWLSIVLSRTRAGNQRFHNEFRRRVAPGHHEQLYPRLLFWLRRDIEWHPDEFHETGPISADPPGIPRRRTRSSENTEEKLPSGPA
jgi:hypothetical protein